jgi:hypothetical protein
MRDHDLMLFALEASRPFAEAIRQLHDGGSIVDLLAF